MKWYPIFLTFSIVFLSACGEEEKKELPKPAVYEVKNIGLLSTTEYTVGKIVQMDDAPGERWVYGDRKLLISCKAKIKAGIDMSKIKEGDIEVIGNTVKIKLPPATITSFTMDPNQIHTKMESITGFRDKFTQVEKNKFMRQGEDAIRDDILQTGIIKDAEKNAELFLGEFYKQMGFDKVIVDYGEEADYE
ncbi:MAG: hypothetical protein ACI837_000368 [Crocinitomicaceae bacterium]|jgi:hypothetical protein